MVIAISPVLIMVLVHSVCFFLVEVFYRGEGAGGVRWVLFWFILAVVLITRIGIEQGEAQAIGYGLALTFAVGVDLLVAQSNFVFAAVLLGIVWFTAHKLTSNCTLIDDEADASGQGLLQSLWRLPRLMKKIPPVAEKSAAPPLPFPPVPAKKKNKSQKPGVWLLYYSLAAVPVFGLGQTLLPSGDLAARHQAFVYLFFYLAAALGLFVTTSFLGLRRYLRQRYVTMPGNIACGWILTGAVAVAVVLGLSLLLPRPGAHEAWVTLRYHVDHQLRRASDFAMRFNPHGTGSGRVGNQDSPNAPQGDKSGPGFDSNPNSKDNGNNPGQNGQQPGGSSGSGEGGNQPHENGAGQAGNQGANGQNGVSAKSPASSPPASSLYSWLRILFWFAVALGLAWLIYWYRVLILALLQSIWAAIRSFIATLLGLFKPSPAAASAAAKKPGVASFKSFKNPFLTGGDRVWPPEQLITYSYDALQSWVLENEAVRGSPQTPREFCRQLGEEMPEAADALEHLAFLYGHVAYGATVPVSYNPGHLRLIWDLMANARPARSTAPVAEDELAGKG
jgi:hypothetical protein